MASLIEVPAHVLVVERIAEDLETEAHANGKRESALADARAEHTRLEVERARIERLVREDRELVARVTGDHDAAMRDAAGSTMQGDRSAIEKELRRRFPGADPATARQTLSYRLDARIAEGIRASERVQAAGNEVARLEKAATDRGLENLVDDLTAALQVARDLAEPFEVERGGHSGGLANVAIVGDFRPLLRLLHGAEIFSGTPTAAEDLRKIESYRARREGGE